MYVYKNLHLLIYIWFFHTGSSFYCNFTSFLLADLITST